MSLDDELRDRHSRRGFCPITGVSLSLCEGVVETLPGVVCDARFVDQRTLEADIRQYCSLERDIENIDDQITSLECQRENLSVPLEDVKFRLGLRRDMPHGYRERRAKELERQRRAKALAAEKEVR